MNDEEILKEVKEYIENDEIQNISVFVVKQLLEMYKLEKKKFEAERFNNLQLDVKLNNIKQTIKELMEE